MNAHTPFDAKKDWSNPYCQNSSNDQIVDSLLGNAYHVVRTVYCNLGNLKLLYDLLNQYGMVLGVQSESELKALTTDAKYARIYGFSRAGDRQVTDYLYVEGDRTGILPDDTTATGSWVTVATSGSNSGGTSSGDGAYIPWVYNRGSAIGGETTINVPDGTVGVPFIIINGDMQYVGRGFEFNVDSLSVTLAQPLEEGDEVVFLLTGVPAVPDNPHVNDWVQINWLYNNGAAVGGEQVIAIPYTFQSVPAVYKNGLRLYKGLTTESYTADPDNQRILLTEPLATNDRLIVQIGGEARVLEALDRTFQEVARAANVNDSELILSTDTTQLLNGKKIIYSVSEQKAYGLPSLPSNVYISSVSNGQLTYNPGNITVTLLPTPQEMNTRELWRRSLAEAGYNLVDGSFEAGGTLVNANDVLLQERTGKAFSGPAGTVAAGTNPVADGYADKSGELLRSQLAGNSGANLIGFQPPDLPQRKVGEKLSEKLSVLDFGLVCDGVTDDTAAWNAMLPKLNAKLAKAYIPAGCTAFLQAGTSIPLAGMIGDGHMASKVRVKTPVVATTETVGLIYGTVGAYDNSYGRIEGVRIEVDDDTTSPLVLVKLNTVSRGAGMRDVTLHCGIGSCVGVEDFYYYQFDNVVFEGRYIPDNLISSSNPLKGKAFKQLANKAINNIQFNKCDFRYLEEPFESAGTFIGSNSIGLYNCAIEKMGRGLGKLDGWLVTFTEGYWEKLGLNQSYAAGEESLFSCGAGAVTANGVLANLGSLPAGNPLINAVLCTVRFKDVFGVRPAGFTSTVLRQNTYSSRGVVICDNSPVFDENKQPAYTRIPQQHVGGYTGPRNDSVSHVMGSSNYSRNYLAFLPLNVTDTFSLNERVVAHLLLPTSSKYTVVVRGVVAHNRSDTSANEQMSFVGTCLLDTSVNTNQDFVFTVSKNGTEFDSTWDAPLLLRYASESGGYRRYEVVFPTKTGRGYSRTVAMPLEINLFFSTGKDGTIGVVPAG